MLTDTTFMPLEFLRPLWLLGIIAVLLFSLLRYKTVQKSKKQGLIAAHLSKNLVDRPEQSSTQRFAFPLLGIIACLALSGPSFRSINMPMYQVEKAQVLVLDLTYSMYATDLQPNRLTQAKYKAIDLIKKWGEGEKALIAYAGDAFTITPLTPDGNAIISHIPNLSPEIMPVTGSHADLALERAITLLKNAGYTQGHIVFISDGIDSQTSEKMIKRLQGTPWVVSILAMATPQGAAIKLPDGSLLKNQQKQIVIPKLEQKPLYNITRATNGLYVNAANNNDDIKLLSRYFSVEKAHKSNSDQSSKTRFAKDDGYWLTFLLLPLLLLLFRKGVFYILVLTLTFPLLTPETHASILKNQEQNAFQAYQDKDYATAAQLYDEPLAKGSAYYKNKQYKEALEQFTQATIDHPNNANAFYNQGNSYAQLNKLDKAITAYQQALIIEPKMDAAQENKKLIEELKKQQQQKEKQQSDQQKSEQQKSEQQKSEQQKSDQQQSNQQQPNQQQPNQQQPNQQQPEQQKSEQQKSEQQKSDQQQSNQQQPNQQQSEQQKSEQQKSEQQKSEQQKSEQQKSEQQKSEQQQSEQQKSEQQKSERQKSEQQKSEQQKSEQQQSEQQKSEQQQSEQQKSEQQQSEQQQSEQQKAAQAEAKQGKESPQNKKAQALTESQETQQSNKELEDLPNWLKNMPDDPSLLLRNKMRLEYQKRAQSQPVEQQQNNGEIW